MKKGLIKAGVLMGVFIVAVLVLEFIYNASGVEMTHVMSEASLPVVYIRQDNQKINPLHGYVKKMDAVYTRDTITPLEDGLSLAISIQNFGANIEEIGYEVRSLDSSRLIEDTTITEFEKKKQSIEAVLPIQNLLDEGVEYQLIITVKADEREVYYYTRIMVAKDMHTKECVKFAKQFHENTFDKDKMPEMVKYMEPDRSMENTDLHKVNIHSSMEQLFWSEFKCGQIGKTRVSLKEVKKEYCVLILSYELGAKGHHGESEYYNVEEYYRIRFGQERMYLLEFERTMTEVFQEDGDNFTEDGVRLGIRSDSVNYVSNETGTVIGFVQEGDLWQYNSTAGSLVRVFSFRDYENMGIRENNNQHDIRVVRVDETGSMDFIVYGYMNRGIHEGMVGISVLHFDSIGSSVEELAWIPSTKSYQMIEEVVGKVMYVNDNNQFYIMMEGIIYKIDLLNRKETVLEQGDGDGEDWFVSSEDNRYLAWLEGGDANVGQVLHVCDMSSGEEKTIEVSDKEYVRPLGFIGKDLIYGVAKKKRVTTGISGVTVFPMHVIYIVNSKGEVKKEYRKKNIFITSISTEDYTIRLNRAKYKNNSYVAISQDSIMNLAGNSKETTSVQSYKDGEKQMIVAIKLSTKIKNADPNLIAAKLVSYSDNRTMALESTGDENYYYAYAKGKVMVITPSESEAVRVAAANNGVVVDGKAQYIWDQAKSIYKNTLPGMRADTSKVGAGNAERALSVILKKEGVTISVGELLSSGSSAKEILEKTIPESTVLDLSECSVDQMFYYVDKGYPVYGMVSDKKPVLICGYTRERVLYYDPSYNEVKGCSLNQARQMFANAGNIFLAYVVKEDH